MSSNRILNVTDLKASYGAIEALKGVNLIVAKGSFVAVVGRNGAGKSTLLNTICGIIKAKSGSVKFHETDITDYSVQKRVRSGIALVPEGRKVIATLSVRENLILSRASKIKSEQDLETWTYELFPRLKERRTQYAGSLSGGEQQMLAIGRAIMTNPQLVVLDEPSMGLAPFIVDKVFESLITINNSGISLLLVEQDASLAAAVSDYMYVVQQGHVVAEGQPADLAQNDFVASGYFS